VSKKQTRRSISVKGTTYERIRLALQGHDRVLKKTPGGPRTIGSVADFVEQCLAERLDELDVPQVAVAPAHYPKPRKADETVPAIGSGYFTF